MRQERLEPGDPWEEGIEGGGQRCKTFRVGRKGEKKKHIGRSDQETVERGTRNESKRNDRERHGGKKSRKAGGSPPLPATDGHVDMDSSRRVRRSTDNGAATGHCGDGRHNDASEGRSVRVVREVGGTLCAIHMNRDRTRAYFGCRRKVESAGALEEIAWKGVPAELRASGNLGS